MDQPSNEYPKHWLEGYIQKIIKRNDENIALSTGKTPSGHIHLGIMREILICDALTKILKQRGISVDFRLFFDNLDAAKRFPPYIPEEFSKKYIGLPFVLIPNPFQTEAKNYAQYFADELVSTFPKFGIDVEVKYTNELYKTDEMKQMIRKGLKENTKVKEIVAKYLTASMNDNQKEKYLNNQKTWMGAMVICENCQCTQKKQKDGNITPNRVLKYNEDTDEAEYHCPACDHHGTVKLTSGLVKLNWRLDWPAKWTIFHTTCEPAGKDHCTPGGSYDTGLDLCKSIYEYEGPIKLAYEWLRLGDRDMKTSKGIVFTPTRFLELADPRLMRMIILQTNPNKHISFRIEELEQYYNEYDRIEKIYYDLEDAASEQEKMEVKYIYPLLQIGPVPNEKPSRLPFKLLTVLAQLLPILKEEGVLKKAQEYLEKEEGLKGQINSEEFKLQLSRAQNWTAEINQLLKDEKDPQIVKKIKRKVVLFSITESITDEVRASLTDLQKQCLSEFIQKSEEIPSYTDENVKEIMVYIREGMNIKPMKLFQAFYLIFLGEKRGPRLGPLMAMLEKEWINDRIQSAIK